jgi:hypothetical protein
MKKLISFILLCSTICFSDLITTFEFDVEESSVFQFTRPGWNSSNTNSTFYYNLAYFTVDTAGDWKAQNNLITSNDSFDYTNYQPQFEQTPWFNADTYVYLYKDTFDASDPSKNLIAQNDDGFDGGNGLQFELSYNLETNTTYWSVITTFNPEEEIAGVVSVIGPQGAGINLVTIPEPHALGLIFISGIGLLVGKRLFR